MVLSLVVGLLPEPAGAGGAEGEDRRHGYLPRSSATSSTEARLALRGAGASRPPGRSPSRLATALAPVVEDDFDGIPGLENRVSPSDTVGAAGLTRVVTAVNVRYAVYDRTGIPLRGPASIKALFPGLPSAAQVFDPKVVYDHYRQRFVLVAVAGRFGFNRRAWILIAGIPDATAEDPSTWCRRRLKADHVPGFGNLWADYPGLGFDRERVYITSNQFTFGNRFRYAQILALRKRGLYDCDAPLGLMVFARNKTRDPQGTAGFTIQPAVTETDENRDPPEYLLSFQDTEICRPEFLPCGRRLTVWRISETRDGLRLRKQSVGTAEQLIAPLGTQKGGDADCDTACWDTGDLRLINAFYDADQGLLYGAHVVSNPDTSGYLESVVRWYEVDVTPWGATTVHRTGLIVENGRDAGWPVVATDGPGNVLITYSRAGAPSGGEYLSAYAASVDTGKPPPAPAVQLLRAGQATYVEGRARDVQRWGDYNGINRDPLEPLDVWMVNQIAADDGEGAATRTDQWFQVVHRVSEGP
jgi:hypothetical protein